MGREMAGATAAAAAGWAVAGWAVADWAAGAALRVMTAAAAALPTAVSAQEELRILTERRPE